MQKNTFNKHRSMGILYLRVLSKRLVSHRFDIFLRSTTIMNGNQQQSVELPPNFKPCSLKGRPFTPTFDTSCHNTQGIDVWANKGPRPYAPGKSSTLPRKTAGQT